MTQHSKHNNRSLFCRYFNLKRSFRINKPLIRAMEGHFCLQIEIRMFGFIRKCYSKKAETRDSSLMNICGAMK